MTTALPLSTDRSDGVVFLDRFVETDAATLFAADHDAEHRRWFGFPADFEPSLRHSQEVIMRWNREIEAGTRFPFAIRDVGSRELLGGCELRPSAAGGALASYWTFPPHRRRGIASRGLLLLCRVAAVEMRIAWINLEIDPNNSASQGVALRCGFAELTRNSSTVRYRLDLDARDRPLAPFS